MSQSQESEFTISKLNRRQRLASIQKEVVKHQTLLFPHKPKTKDILKRAHEAEKRALKRR